MAKFGTTTLGMEVETQQHYFMGSKYTCTDGGTANSLTVYITNWQPGESVYGAIYDASRNLIAETNARTSGGYGWQYFYFATPPTLTAGADYIIVMGSGSRVAFNATNIGGTDHWKELFEPFGSPAPDPLSASDYGYRIALYCNYTAATTTTTTTATTSTVTTTTTLAPITDSNKRQWKVWIDDIEVTSFLVEGAREETYGSSIPILELSFTRNVTSLVTLGADKTIVVWEGFPNEDWVKIWDGYVETYKPDGALIKVFSRNKLADAIRKEITRVYDKSIIGDPCYPDGKLSDIASDIISNFMDLTPSVQDSGTDIVLSKFVCNHADPLERLKKLQESLGWVLYYRDDTDIVYFEPKGFTSAPTSLAVGTNIIGIPKWTISKDQMINDLTLEGAIIEEPRSETKTGDASETIFTIDSAQIPTHFEVYYGAATDFTSTAPTQAQHQTGVTEGTLVGTYNYTFDLKNKFIKFTSFVPASSADNILINYWVATPNPIHRTNSGSICDYGRYKRTITLTDVMNVEDAEKRCQMILEKFSLPFETGKMKMVVSVSGWRVGQLVSITDTVNSPNVADDFVIIKHIKKYPGNIDEIIVGDKEWIPIEWQASILERVKRLEESTIGDATVVNEIVDNKISFGVVPDYQQIVCERINDSFVGNITPNSIVYADDETKILNNFEDVSVWTDMGITTAKATANSTQGTTGDYLTGTGAIQFSSTQSGVVTLRCTSAVGDISNCVGTTVGIPSQGTFGVWLRTTQTSNFTSTIQFHIGHDASNYNRYNEGQTYAQKVAQDTTSYNLDSGWTLLLFDATNPTQQTGTVSVDWTNINNVRVSAAISDATTFNLDYLTVSKNDTISLCGGGSRFTTYQTLTKTY